MTTEADSMDNATDTYTLPSILSYRDRGPWGSGTYRGNMSGYLVRDMIFWLSNRLDHRPRLVFDPMSGSWTTHDVCTELGVPSLSCDLRDAPPTDANAHINLDTQINHCYTGWDILNKSNQRKAYDHIMNASGGRGADLIMFHPPYWSMIPYSTRGSDFSSGRYSLYLERMGKALRWLSYCLSNDGVIAMLLGDLRKQGMDQTYFLTDDTTSASTMAWAYLEKLAKLIKVQHMTLSRGAEGNDLDIQMLHEYVTIMRTTRFQRSI